MKFRLGVLLLNLKKLSIFLLIFCFFEPVNQLDSIHLASTIALNPHLAQDVLFSSEDFEAD